MANRIIKIILTCLFTALAVLGFLYLMVLFGRVGYLPPSVLWISRLLCAAMIFFSIYIAKKYLDD